MNVSPLRAAVLGQAEAEVDVVLADADRRAAAELARAQAEAEAQLGQARTEGERAGELETARDRALAHREARRLVLEARRSVYEEFRRETRAAALSLRGTDAYPALLEGLAKAARDQLGDGAELEIDPLDAGGVRGRARNRGVDYTLPALADRCIAALGAELEGLWR